MASPAAKLSSLPGWWSAATPFVVVGASCVIVGGLISAIVATAPSENGSWAVAYLVLVAGVAQAALGIGQSRLAAAAPSNRVLAIEFAAWNAGNAAVIAGQLGGVEPVVDIGGVLLIAALALFVRSTRHASPAAGWPTALLWAFRVVVLIVLVSAPIGMVIGQVKA